MRRERCFLNFSIYFCNVIKSVDFIVIGCSYSRGGGMKSSPDLPPQVLVARRGQ